MEISDCSGLKSQEGDCFNMVTNNHFASILAKLNNMDPSKGLKEPNRVVMQLRPASLSAYKARIWIYTIALALMLKLSFCSILKVRNEILSNQVLA